MKYLLILFFFIASLNIRSQAQACDDLPNKFTSFSTAIEAIRAADFQFTDKIPDGSSPLIITAEYFSCDGYFGYFICSTSKNKVYIYENVPKNIWSEFKNAGSKGTFYNKHLKTKYRLIQTSSIE